MTRRCLVVGATVLLAVWPAGAHEPAARGIAKWITSKDREAIARLQSAISRQEMEKILVPFNSLDRVSGSEGEARGAELLAAALARYGVPHTVHRFRAYLSWPLSAELGVVAPEQKTFRSVTAAFSTSTGPGGLEGELVFLGSPGAIFGPTTAAYAGKDVRGKIAVSDGLITPQNARMVEDLGAIGLVHINPRELLHEMIMTTVWGTPTPKTRASIPRIPALSISHADGEWLKEAASRGAVRVRLVTEVSTKWREIPLVVAEVKGAIEPEKFILISSHLDAWYKGMTDTASTDASILEMARILHEHRGELRRGFRFAWWTGHSTGRYAGSTWFADRFWSDLDRDCVGYMNLDGPGARSVPLDRVSTWAWPELADFTKEFARELTGKEPEYGYFAGPTPIFRPFRAGDSSFQGLGIPEFSIGLPEIQPGHGDYAGYVGGSERGWWWHTAEDTLDKIDMNVLVRDTQLRLAELYTLANLPVLPYRLAPIAGSFRAALGELGAAAPRELDLRPLLDRAQRFQAAATELDAEADKIRRLVSPDPSVAAGLNRLLLRLTHHLNAVLYTSSGRYEQDAAAPLPILAGLDPARRLARLDPLGDEFGFLLTQMVRERNRTADALDEAIDGIAEWFSRPPMPMHTPSHSNAKEMKP